MNHEYRVLLIGTDGCVQATEEAMCESDDAACELARAILTDCPVREVWSGDRRVAVIRPQPPPLPPVPAEDE
jgi:hypothetical protein